MSLSGNWLTLQYFYITAGNVMVQRQDSNSLHVKILDFGLAGQLEGPRGVDYRGFQADIAEIVRLFSGLYTGMEFDSAYDVRHNWREGLSSVSQTELIGQMWL